MVVAADGRMGQPQSDYEQSFGDGSAALLIGDEDIACEIEGSYCHTDDILDTWRTESDTFTKNWEDRFILAEDTPVIPEKPYPASWGNIT